MEGSTRVFMVFSLCFFYFWEEKVKQWQSRFTVLIKRSPFTSVTKVTSEIVCLFFSYLVVFYVGGILNLQLTRQKFKSVVFRIISCMSMKRFAK